MPMFWHNLFVYCIVRRFHVEDNLSVITLLVEFIICMRCFVV